ncbi:MAG: HAD hydrolase-like protein [Pseudomonadota bacterium]|nr:HAD hydrolase-like protein [Pseudomonadota bacterium]
MSARDIILDFDGTLVDSSPAILATFTSVLRARDVTPARPVDKEVVGPPLLQTLRLLTGSDDPRLLDVLAADFRARYDSDGVYATQAYAGVSELLRMQVNAGKRLHLATNKRQRPTLLLLEHFGWRTWFTSIYCIDGREPVYPSKGEMLKVLLQEQGLAASACVYVGDTHHDELAAAQAGIAFVAAGWGYGVGEQAVSDAARVLGSPQELLQVL